MQNDQQKRLLIAVVLSTILMIVWMEFIAPKQTAPAEADAAAQAISPDAGADAAAALPSPADASVAEAVAVVAAPEKSVTFASDSQELSFNSRGGTIEKAIVKNGGQWPQRKFLSRQTDAEGRPQPVEMVRRRPGMTLPGSTELKGDLVLSRVVAYETEQAADSVTFRTSTADLAFEKRYQVFKNSYELRLQIAVTNKSGAAKSTKLLVAYPAWVDPKTQGTGGFFSPPPEVSQATCRHGTSNETLAGKKEAAHDSYLGPVRFVGFDERYFMGMFYPLFTEGVEKTSCTLFSDPSGDREADLEVDLGTIEPGQTARREFGIYLGPKVLEELQRVVHECSVGAAVTPLGVEPVPGSLTKVDPELASSIDFGWWAVICRVLLEVMKIFQRGVVNWGLAIILLTVLVKAILYPLSVKQMASMEAMRRLQPQMDELGKKYEGDKEKLNMERMRLFQENKVNPFGGCLPLLVQMPVWIALYRTLLTSFELYQEPLIGFWISDLTLHDPYYIMPLAMGVTMFITQKMQPTMGDPTQAKVMLYFMPIFFTAIMLNLPAGLTLYIFTNNLLSIAQQKWLQRKFKKQAAAAPPKK